MNPRAAQSETSLSIATRGRVALEKDESEPATMHYVLRKSFAYQ
jgi:hypothetical protein